MMFWLGLLLPTCYVSLWTGVSVPTQWPLLSIFLPALMWGKSRYSPTFLHCLGMGFLVYSFLGLLWAPHPYDTMYGIWIVVLWSLSFQLGFRTDDPQALYKGLAWGVAVSSALAVSQWFGYEVIATYGHNNIAGLLFNRTVLGALSALVILALAQESLWGYIPMLLPGFILCGSRGGWLCLAVGIAARINWVLVLILFVAGCFFFSGSTDSDQQRLLIWAIALKGLTWLGYGAGAFEGVYYINPHAAVHAEFVHNDYLQLPFEFGVMALVPFAILGASLLYRPTPLVWAFAALGTFYFPLYNPTTAFLGCFAVGHALRGVSFHELGRCYRRLDLLLGDNAQGQGNGGARWADIPAQPRPAN